MSEQKFLSRLHEISRPSQLNSPEISAFYKQMYTGRSAEGQIEKGKEGINELDQPGRKTDIRQARIILLGESHTDISHIAINAEIIKSVVRDGDILLIEGVPAFQNLDKKNHKVARFISERLVVRGWDDMDRLQDVVTKQKQIFEVEKEFKDAKRDMRWDRIPVLGTKLEQLEQHKQDVMIRQRNESLFQTIDVTHRQFPEKRIFAIVGYSHLDDPLLTKNLDEKYSYIMFKPPLRETSDDE